MIDDNDDKYVDENKLSDFSEDYFRWVKETNQINLTNNQHRFAEWLLKNKEEITKVGNYVPIFLSIRKWLRVNKKKKS